MGMGKDGIMRFPRTVRRGMLDENGKRMTNFQRVKIQKEAGLVPRGYSLPLKKKHKRVIRLVVNGMKVRKACREVGIDQNTWYRWMNAYPNFKKYYIAYAEKAAELAVTRLEAKIPKAVAIVEESMESEDPYFAYDVAHKHLHGMGIYKKEVKSDRKIQFTGKLAGSMKHENMPMNEDFLKALVGVMTGMAAGAKKIEPKIIDMGKIHGVLPGSTVGEKAEVQEEERAAAG